MSRKTLKYRLYPTPAQETILCRTLAVCRDVYNSLLHERKHDYELTGKSPSKVEQQKHFPVWCKQHPELKSVHSQVLQNVAVRVELAFDAFFSRVHKGHTPGFPRVKGEGYDSFTYPQLGFKVHAQSVYLSKIGIVKAILHRTVEGALLSSNPRKMEQTLKTCTVRRMGDKWFVCFVIEYAAQLLPDSKEQVGMDVGLKAFAALSNGEMIANPKFFRNDEQALAKAQRKLSHQKRGSLARRKAKKVVRRLHERIRNRRHDFIHQTARRLVNRFGLIVVEKLAIKNMSKSPAVRPDPLQEGSFLPNGARHKSGLNKSILDASWGLFRAVLKDKAASAGRQFAEVNPAWTSQDCSGCGTRVKKTLKERVHYCPHCGLSLDRDTNAAINILKIGVGQHTVPG